MRRAARQASKLRADLPTSDPKPLMPVTMVTALALALLAGLPAEAAPPGVVINHCPQSSGLYLGSPSIAILSNGDYLASHDFFGPNSNEHECPTVLIFRSSDRGRTWKELARLRCLFWANLFTHQGAVFIMGTDKHSGRIVIRRSRDGGVTWTEARDATSGILTASDGYHTAPVPVVQLNGRLWRAFEVTSGDAKGGKAFGAGVLSIGLDADPLQATNWAFSNFLFPQPGWLRGGLGGWREGNVVPSREGGILNVLRVDTSTCPEKAAILRVSADGRSTTFNPADGFVTFPGGAKKFTIRRDPQTHRYWSLVTPVLEQHKNAGRPGSIRNALALVVSRDLRKWTTRCILLYGPDLARHGFQYADWQFDGRDLIAVVRTAFDDAEGGPHNMHDANFVTFHRWKNFRELTMADSVPVPWPHSGENRPTSRE